MLIATNPFRRRPLVRRVDAAEREYIAELHHRLATHRLEFIHLELSDGEFYTIGIQDGEHKRMVFADVENVKLINKRRPSLSFESIEDADAICHHYLVYTAAPASFEDLAWMAAFQGAALRILMPNPAATFAWPYDEEIASRYEDMEFE